MRRNSAQDLNQGHARVPRHTLVSEIRLQYQLLCRKKICLKNLQNFFLICLPHPPKSKVQYHLKHQKKGLKAQHRIMDFTSTPHLEMMKVAQNSLEVSKKLQVHLLGLQLLAGGRSPCLLESHQDFPCDASTISSP